MTFIPKGDSEYAPVLHTVCWSDSCRSPGKLKKKKTALLLTPLLDKKAYGQKMAAS